MGIIGIIGFINSGKDTAAKYLVDVHGYKRDSFASALKDAVSVIFGWNRELLEGTTRESREWRDTVDEWWATRLKIPHLTPRWVLQYWGTEVCRKGFHDDIWIASLENRLRQHRTENVVISDVRFPNEIRAIRNAGGKLIRVKRGPEPDWYEDAKNMNQGEINMNWSVSMVRMKNLGIHDSETAWIGSKFDALIENDGTVEELFDKIDSVISPTWNYQESDRLVSTGI